jgi:hypothetical protein
MKTLAFNSEEISFRTGKASSRPAVITPIHSADDERAYFSIIVTFICAESGDSREDVEVTATELVTYARQVGRRLLLVPFVHLSSEPAQPERALELIREVAKLLQQTDRLAGCLGFGYHKALILRWATLEHEGSVIFRDSRYFRRRETKHA